MDLMVLLWKQEGTEAGSLTFLCLLFKKTVMSMCSGNLLFICIYFYNYMEISGTVGVMGEKWIAVVGTVLQTWFWGTDEFSIKLVAFNQAGISKPWLLGVCITSFDPDHKCLLWVFNFSCLWEMLPSVCTPELQIGDCYNNHWFFSCLKSVWFRKTRWGF